MGKYLALSVKQRDLDLGNFSRICTGFWEGSDTIGGLVEIRTRRGHWNRQNQPKPWAYSHLFTQSCIILKFFLIWFVITIRQGIGNGTKDELGYTCNITLQVRIHCGSRPLSSKSNINFRSHANLRFSFLLCAAECSSPRKQG